MTVFKKESMCVREPDIRVEGNFTKNRYWFLLNTGQKIAQVHPKEELRGPKVFPTVNGIVSRDESLIKRYHGIRALIAFSI
jgi:hypothetical protein